MFFRGQGAVGRVSDFDTGCFGGDFQLERLIEEAAIDVESGVGDITRNCGDVRSSGSGLVKIAGDEIL